MGLDRSLAAFLGLAFLGIVWTTSRMYLKKRQERNRDREETRRSEEFRIWLNEENRSGNKGGATSTSSAKRNRNRT